jgi:hypothetical protein
MIRPCQPARATLPLNTSIDAIAPPGRGLPVVGEIVTLSVNLAVR